MISDLTRGVTEEEPDDLALGDESCHQQVASIQDDVGFDLTNAPGHLIRRAQQVHTSVWTEVVGEELTSSQFAVLNVLYDKPDIDQTTLSQLASLDTSTCQDIVARLKLKGLVERVRDISDGRRWRLRLSENGRQTRAMVVPKVIEVGEILFGAMSLADRADFARLLFDVTRRGDRGQ
ncbi:MAG: winged helix-turn-helix transcriptional regulator [Acidimicrobiaceae bacterium]|nr:winged helix-turn-helix transcriptional regulator [Acidimicrobiaceae bacterium]